MNKTIKHMKRILSLWLVGGLFLSVTSGKDDSNNSDDPQTRIVATNNLETAAPLL